MRLLFGFIRAIAEEFSELFYSREEKLRLAVQRNDRNRHDEPQYSPSEYKQMMDPSWNGLSEEEWEKIYRGERALDTEPHGSPPHNHPVRTTRIFDGVSHLLDGEPTEHIDLDRMEYVRDEAPADDVDSVSLEQLRDAAAQLAEDTGDFQPGDAGQASDSPETSGAEATGASPKASGESDAGNLDSDQGSSEEGGSGASDSFGYDFKSDFECDGIFE